MIEQASSTKPKRLPGPAGTSCLTCKRRRKKCDQGRPTCQKCVEGGYDCLGYDHIQQRKAAKSNSATSHHGYMEGHSRPLASVNKNEGSSIGDSDQLAVSFALRPQNTPFGGYYEAPFYEPAGYSPSTEASSDSTPIHSSLVTVNNSLWNALSSPLFDSPADPEETNADPSHLSNLYRPSFLVGAQTAQGLSTLSLGERHSIHYVLNLFERVFDSVYFKPRDHHATLLRNVVVNRIQASSITRCAVVLAAKMVESMLNGNSSNNRITFKESVHRFETHLHAVKAGRLNQQEIQYLLNGFLEVAFLKMRVSNGYNAYRLLRNAAPTFLEIVYSDPGLWPDPSGPPAVCMSKVITSTRFELGHFALMDVLCSMAYGLPQVIDYETATLSPEAEIHPIEWVHGCPLEFQICIALMNDRCTKSYVAPDWQMIEHRLQSYKVRLTLVDQTESWRNIARLAVVESWRQALLIYLYMAVCGISSNDIRVQSAVRQVFQLFKTVKRQEPPKVNVHFMFQYLIAGACTRNETQRALVRERLLDSFDNECWLLPGSDMVPVLDHLWHGAAANGRPFKWSDYITSRQIALPIPI
ncbi:hypothetical protein RHS03_01292, partial [Rhizoctonia solani]